MLLGAQPLVVAEALRGGLENVFEQGRRTVGVGVGESGFVRRLADAQMNEFAETTMQAVADFAQRVGAGELAEQHGDELGPARKALGVAFGLVLFDERLELAAGKVLEQLIEQAGGLYHGDALLGDWGWRTGPLRNRLCLAQL